MKVHERWHLKRVSKNSEHKPMYFLTKVHQWGSTNPNDPFHDII